MITPVVLWPLLVLLLTYVQFLVSILSSYWMSRQRTVRVVFVTVGAAVLLLLLQYSIPTVRRLAVVVERWHLCIRRVSSCGEVLYSMLFTCIIGAPVEDRRHPASSVPLALPESSIMSGEMRLRGEGGERTLLDLPNVRVAVLASRTASQPMYLAGRGGGRSMGAGYPVCGGSGPSPTTTATEREGTLHVPPVSSEMNKEMHDI